MSRFALPILFVLGCEGVSTHPSLPDALPASDAPPTPATHRYIVNKETLPKDANMARALGFDLNEIAGSDNQLGKIVSTVLAMGVDVQSPLDLAIANGQILALGQLVAPENFEDGEATFAAFSGIDPLPSACADEGGSMVCGRHLDGTATIVLDPVSPRDTPLAGEIANGTFEVAGDRIALFLALADSPLRLDLLNARVQATADSDGLSGRIGGGITTSQMDSIILPALATTLDQTVAAACPGPAPTCNCHAGSTGSSVQNVIDANDDCRITATEVRTSAFIGSLFQPDLDLLGVDAYSFAIGFTAVKATFSP